MTENTPQQSITERYQQIQALTPSDEPLNFSDTPSITISTFLSLSMFIFFFVLIFLGFLPLVIQKFRDFKRFQMALLLAFVGGALPLTLGLMFAKTGLLTKASVEETPKNVIVEVATHSFTVNWETENSQYGAISYGETNDKKDLGRTALESEGLKKAKEHQVVVDNLEAGKVYYFMILSGARWYDNAGELLQAVTGEK